MCLKDARKPTKKERATITEGYKIFETRTNLVSPFYYFCFRDWESGRWFEARNGDLDVEADPNAGFHVLLDREDAEKLKQDMTHNGNKNIVVKHVQLRNIFYIGQPTGMGNVCHQMKDAVTCKEIKILPD